MTFTLNKINAGGNTIGAVAIASPFVSVFNEQQHFGYLDGSGRIWDSWYNPSRNSWNLQQINAGGRTQGPTAVAGPSIGVYQNQQHFAYLDGKGAIWDSWYDGGKNVWNLQQLNLGGRTSGPAAKPGVQGKELGPVSVWVDPSNSQQHFTYLGTDSAVYDAFWDSNANQWKLQKISVGGVTNGPPAASSPIGCIYHSQQHIAYLDSAGNINDSWYDGSGHWSLQRIGGLSAVPNQPFSWVDPTDTQQHFTYLGPDSAVYDAYWDSNKNSWQEQKINVGGNTQGPAAKGLPNACVFGKEEHFGYLDGVGNIWDSFRDSAGSWHLQQVNSGPAAVDVVFLWTSITTGNQLHFTYRDVTGFIWDSAFTEASTTPSA